MADTSTRALTPSDNVSLKLIDNGDGTYSQSVATGLIKLGEITQDTVIAAGSSVVVVLNDRERLGVKEVRATARWASGGRTRFSLRHFIRANNITSGGPDQTVENENSSSTFAGKVGDVYGTYYTASIINTNTEDQTLRFCQFMGVC